MKITEFIKKELSGWKKVEILGLFAVIIFIFANAVILKDNPVAVISAVCGILYTIIAGKGKISCYFFGLSGSGCYSLLAFQNALWGHLILYMCYYIPMQILGIFKWKKHLKEDSKEIIKTSMKKNERIRLIIFCTAASIIAAAVLYFFHDRNPLFDGITTILSIAGMYLTVKRCIEQWIIWMIVNGLSFLMWLDVVLHGAKTFSTLVMWGVYFILAIYFYIIWKKELTGHKSAKN